MSRVHKPDPDKSLQPIGEDNELMPEQTIETEGQRDAAFKLIEEIEGQKNHTILSEDDDIKVIQLEKASPESLEYLKKPSQGSEPQKLQPEQEKTQPAAKPTGPPTPGGPLGFSKGPPGLLPARINYMELFKYSSFWERFQVKSGIFFSIIGGAFQPGQAVIIGTCVEMFDPILSDEQRYEKMINFIGYIVGIAVLLYITSYLGYAQMQIAAEKLSFKLRAKYLASLMRQEVEFFEKQQVEALPSKMATYFTQIAEGSGEKTGQMLGTIGSTSSGIIIGLVMCPYYALCLLFYLPFATVLLKKLQGRLIQNVVKKGMMNGKLGGFTEELLSALKLIISFGKEDRKMLQYKAMAQESYEAAKNSAVWAGVMGGSFFGFIMGFSAFSWTIGFFFIKFKIYNPTFGRDVNVRDIVLTYQSIMFGMFTVLQIQSILPAVLRALVVGKDVIEVIDRVPKIKSPCDPNDKDRKSTGVTKIEIEDGIKFDDVYFRYPTAPVNVKDVFQGATFKIKSGTTTAIVGPSGSGKSTIVQMINRFYDPAKGQLTYGSTPLKNLDLTCLREMIGWVGQEPVLIVGTIRENLFYGNKDANEQDLERAINLANAQFIYTLEKGLETYVGSSTVLNLSGGQKQRIAIARALIKRPQILVLDEATSALDPKSEAEVQNAILNVQKQQSGNLTIIMIAHRLQTIMTAENLLYMENPKSIIAAQKGTPEYIDIMDRLKKTNYAHQANDAPADGENKQKIESDSEDDKQDEGSNDQSQESNRSNQSQQSKVMDKEGRKESRAIALQIQRNSKLTPEAKAALESKHAAEKLKLQTTYISQNAGWKRIFSLYKPHWSIPFMVFLAAINSFGMPVVAILLINLQFTYYQAGRNPEWEDNSVTLLILMWFWMVIVIFMGIAEKIVFGIMGEKLTLKLRLSLIEEIMHKQVSWFDREDRAPGIITSVISSDITSLNGMTTEVLVSLFEMFATTSIAIIGGFYFCWQAAIMATLLSPIMVLGVYLMSKMQWGKRVTKGDAEIDSYQKANALLSDVVINYRTVISLGQKNVDAVNKKYEDLLTGPMEDVLKKSNTAGLYFGLGASGRIIYISTCFIIGILVLIYKWGIDSTNVFSSIYLLFFAIMSIGSQAANVPSIMKAKASAIPVFSMIDEPSTLDIRKPEGRNLTTVEKGKIEFINCYFNYPSRAQKVMENFSLEIPAGSKIALVGHSGCGKSTLTNILLRFYNLNEGKVLIDGEDIDKYDVLKLRDQCGYVMQEPILFNANIKTNILFGKHDATDEEVYIAALKANALQFIESNNEDLTEQQKIENLDKALQKAFTDMQPKGLMQIAALYPRFTEKPKIVKQLIVDLMTRVDDKFLEKAEKNSSDFLKAIDKVTNKYGAGWEDVVISFEWRDELEAILACQTLSSDIKGIVSAAIDKFKDLYGAFNLTSVQEWNQKGQHSLQDFATYVRDQLTTYRMNQVNKRFNELQYMAIDKMRGPDGVFTLHEGFMKECGLKGGKLSGGQKQRIAIARALIKNPRILILDEATSALDEQSQEVVQQALDRAMEGRTSIVIAHRLSTIRNCDILYLLGNGHVIESGSYDELASDPNSHFNVLKAGMEN